MIYTYDNTMPNALQLTGVAGALNNILKTYLVTGAGAGSVSTLTVAAGVATANYASGHPFKAGGTAQFAGATPAALNGLKKVLTATTNSITFAAAGLPDGAATGSITSKLAAAGWTELYPGTANVLALKPSVPEATGCVIRVDDSNANAARVNGFLSLTTDINSGQGPFPTQAQFNGGVYWPKSNQADSSARSWTLIADERSFLLHVCPHGGNQAHGVLLGFGDIVSVKSGDAYACYLSGGDAGVQVATQAILGCLGYGSGTAAANLAYLARTSLGVGGSIVAKKVAAHNTGAAYSGAAGYNGNGLRYPNGADNSLRISPVELLTTADGIRGNFPGVYHCPQILDDAFSTGDTLPGEGGYAGRSFRALRVGPPAAASAGIVFVDVSGPWR